MTQDSKYGNANVTSHIRAALVYRYDDSGESGRELITLIADDSGQRTVHAHCELDDVSLTREASINYGPGFVAQDGYIYMRQNGKFLGSGWYRFGKDRIVLEAETATDGRVKQKMDFDEPIGVFAPHPVFLDGWHATRHDPNGPATQYLQNCITSSPLWHGGSGPLICVQNRRLERIQDTEITVPAGTFDCESYKLIPAAPGLPPIQFWVHGPHKLFVKLRWDHLHATYELNDLIVIR